MTTHDRPIANPYVQLREEFDDWAILFNPDTGCGYGLNPTGVSVWKLLDGAHTLDEMLTALRRDGEGVPDDASTHIVAFVDALVAEGLVGFSKLTLITRTSYSLPHEGVGRDTKFTYEAPRLIDFGGGQRSLGACINHGSQGGDCVSGAGATGCCNTTGGCPTTTIMGCCYNTGACAVNQCCGQGSHNAISCSAGNHVGQ